MATLRGVLSLILLLLLDRAAADVVPFLNSEAYMHGAWGNYTRQRYLSDPHITGPVANFLVPPQPGVSPSKYVMWAPGGPYLPRTRPMMLDATTLATVWQGPVYGFETMGPTVQSCNGTEYITWWSGADIQGYKQGRFYLFNTNYELVYNITGVGNLTTADAHDIFITPECTAIFTAYQSRSYDLSSYNLTDGWLMDSYFQEVDLATGELVFEWSASQHVNVTDAIWQPHHKKQGLKGHEGYDFFHINSVEKDRHGNYLVSGRHTCSVYYISGVDGSVLWRVGGKFNDFEDLSGGKATDFTWQHHARWVDQGLTRISLYDDRATAYHRDSDPVSRGIIIEFDYERKTVKLVQAYPATQGIESLREGSTQVLQDSPQPGNVINGYGQEPGWTEYAPNGTVLMDVMLGPKGIDRWSADNYRLIKVNWTGTPAWSPRIAAGPKPEYAFDPQTEVFRVRLHDDKGMELANNTVFFSWNGATEHRYWVVLASNDTMEMEVSRHFCAQVSRSGFEDSMHIGSHTRYAMALAVDEHDRVLGHTAVLEMQVAVSGEQNSTWQLHDDHEMTLDSLADQWQDFLALSARQKWMPDGVGSGQAAAYLLLMFLSLGLGVWCMTRRSRIIRYLRLRRTRAVEQTAGLQRFFDDDSEDDDGDYRHEGTFSKTDETKSLRSSRRGSGSSDGHGSKRLE